MPTADQVRAAVDAYASALEKRDRDAWLDAFTENASVIDPVPAEPNAGREAIGKFWDGMMAMAERVVVEQRGLHLCGDQAALEYTLTLGPRQGGGMAFAGVEIFTVDDDGKITSAVAYWDPSEIHPVEETPTREEDDLDGGGRNGITRRRRNRR
ncbi:MAG: nuclear transport factor 2 family protein [Acidimicrobiales bacterium]